MTRDCVFLDAANGMWLIKTWQGADWLYYWNLPNQRWIPLKVIDFDQFWKGIDPTEIRLLPEWQAALYDSLSSRWPEPVPVVPKKEEETLFPTE